jgi:hypothetical protein
MQIRHIIAVALIGLLAIPATAGQLATRTTAPGAPMAGFADPNLAPTLSITLPVRFVAPEVDLATLQSFKR